MSFYLNLTEGKEIKLQIRPSEIDDSVDYEFYNMHKNLFSIIKKKVYLFYFWLFQVPAVA